MMRSLSPFRFSVKSENPETAARLASRIEKNTPTPRAKMLIKIKVAQGDSFQCLQVKPRQSRMSSSMLLFLNAIRFGLGRGFELPVDHMKSAMTDSSGFAAVSDEEQGGIRSLGEGFDQIENPAAGLGVEISGWFIGE